MKIDMAQNLSALAAERGIAADDLRLPQIALEADSIRVVMISEVPPENPEDDFYSRSENPAYAQSALALFGEAGVELKSMDDLLGRGVYVTNAVKSPKQGYAVENETIERHLPLLERELELFPNLKVVMLMGDVAKKAFNKITKKNSGKNAVPSGSTYKIRGEAFFYRGMRVFPSYIITGGNILIEKSKRTMIADDIRRMMEELGA